MNLHRNERGQMLVMTAIELTLLIGFLALATDVGVLFHSKRKMQIAADAAATAGALNDYNHNAGYTKESDKAAALNAASVNGYTDGVDGVNIVVNTPPASGYHKTAGFVEVIISKPDPLYFFRVFTGNGTATVAARAVAGDPEGATGCGWTNNMYIGGNFTLEGATSGQKTCGIYVHGSASSLDNGTKIYADFVHALDPSTNFNTQPTPTQIVKSNPPQPYANTYQPDPNGADSGMCTSSNTYTKAAYTGTGLPSPMTSYTYTQTLSDGTTTSGTIDNVYCFSQNVSIGADKTTTSLPTGFYVFEQGATLYGQVNFGLDGNGCYQPPAPPAPGSNGAGTASQYGAVIYNDTGLLQMGDSTSQLAACGPTDVTYPYNGIAIMQPDWNSSNLELVFGNTNLALGSCSLANASLNGWIVAPTAALIMHDQGGGIAVTGFVSDSIGLPKAPGNGNGGANGTVNMCNYNTVDSGTTPFKVINLVE